MVPALINCLPNSSTGINKRKQTMDVQVPKDKLVSKLRPKFIHE